MFSVQTIKSNGFNATSKSFCFYTVTVIPHAV